ncbi:MAG: hypothetical protein JEZ12_04685 [Desulfobacterium sp.]|nr:hypothetical protein [Desulfobacterium sp.]
MKVTDPEIIRTGERDLIDAVKEDLDWDAVREIVKKKINISSVDTTGGQIVVHDNQVAFRVDLELKVDLSLMFDRDGNHIPEQDGAEEGTTASEPPGKLIDIDPEPEPLDENSEIEPGVLDGDDLSPEGVEFGLDDFSAEDSEISLDDLALGDDGEAESLDDDIDEILKESREFWEKKKTEE